MASLIPLLIGVFLIAIVSTRFVQGKECQDIQSVEVDEKWYKKHDGLGWENPMGSKTEVKKELEDIPVDNMILNNVRCVMMDVQVGDAPAVQLRMNCRYEKIQNQNCVVQSNGSAVENIFQFFGNVTIIKTDNEKYVLHYICLYGEREAWTVYTPVGEKLSTGSEDAILKFLESKGISTDKKDMKSKDDEIYIGKLKGVECKSEPVATSDKEPKSSMDLPIPSVLGKGSKSAIGIILETVDSLVKL